MRVKMRTCVCNPAALKAAEELHARSKGYSTSVESCRIMMLILLFFSAQSKIIVVRSLSLSLSFSLSLFIRCRERFKHDARGELAEALTARASFDSCVSAL